MKRWFYKGIALLLVAFSVAFICYAAYLDRAEEVWLGKSFYFLVSETDHVEAGTHNVRLDGGAGYLLEYDRREYVALSVYLSGENGNAVQTVMRENGENTKLLQVDADRLYFKSHKEKKNAELYQAALGCLYSNIEVLEKEIVRLDESATQQSAKRILRILSQQFNYLGKEYKEEYATFSEVCKHAGAELSRLIKDTVYVNDLRYLLCDLSERYITLAAAFSL